MGLTLSPITITYDDSWGKNNTIGHEKQEHKPWIVREEKLYASVVTDVQGDAKRDVKKGTCNIVCVIEWIAFVSLNGL